MIPKSCLYTERHEWLRREGTRAIVGITHYAASQLGDVTFVELPEPGRQVSQGEAFALVESVKAVSDVYAPAGGTVVAVNTALSDEPQRVNESPYDKGWFCEITLEDEGELGKLMDAAAYHKHVQSLGE